VKGLYWSFWQETQVSEVMTCEAQRPYGKGKEGVHESFKIFYSVPGMMQLIGVN